ncbi:hypothetical protein RFI_21150 [Reticulomyxa filosa]|uniref:CCHC-type domain-containing protein n=1 Tax=Reticulomyxa filosa TaxID=46433 RepID=X6MQR8_RETFI|nr:hypothetical protein RFI_21150 [Reticulomyxa filosa]|eukprot:ETO16209.1 hypothetical protein RFI_21150 [Reticulomyxa filosa]
MNTAFVPTSNGTQDKNQNITIKLAKPKQPQPIKSPTWHYHHLKVTKSDQHYIKPTYRFKPPVVGDYVQSLRHCDSSTSNTVNANQSSNMLDDDKGLNKSENNGTFHRLCPQHIFTTVTRNDRDDEAENKIQNNIDTMGIQDTKNEEQLQSQFNVKSALIENNLPTEQTNEVNKNSERPCQKCLQKGHTENMCNREKWVCYCCGQQGHLRRHCPKSRCFHCNALGHGQNHCPQLNRESAI